MSTAELEAASNRIQRALPGDPVPSNEGWVLRTRIQNTRHGATINLDDRSAGFVWLFSFVIWFNQVRSNIGENLVLLLDDPGLSLHANAQKDLLRYFEERLAPEYQIIYTTHSPFMIDATKLSRAQTVENVYIEAGQSGPGSAEMDLGTKVGDHELSTNLDTLFPLQAALAYEISRSLISSKPTVLVEGPSEAL